jgi:tRNA nucleotidyltransferase (CCA-adding enzyme)
MALDDDGTLVDPFDGAKDLKDRVLRHVSEAFAEDPVRILRLARFAARFGFKVHPGTLELMRSMVDSGEADHLVAERVWQEFSRGLAEAHPERMFEVLERCGFRGKVFPELQAWPKTFSGSIPVRFALLTWPLSEAEIGALAERLRAPSEVRDLAVIAARNRKPLANAARASAHVLLGLLKSADAFRRPERFAELLEAAKLAVPGIDVARIERALRAAAAVDAGSIAKSAPAADIARLIDEARAKAIGHAL